MLQTALRGPVTVRVIHCIREITRGSIRIIDLVKLQLPLLYFIGTEFQMLINSMELKSVYFFHNYDNVVQMEILKSFFDEIYVETFSENCYFSLAAEQQKM